MMSKLWKDEAGFIVSAELVLIATILVLGLITGLTAVRNALVSELTEVALAISMVDQSYSYKGLSNCCSYTAGSGALDGTNSFGSGAVPTTVNGINVNPHFTTP